jgi:Importin beta binding domain
VLYLVACLPAVAHTACRNDATISIRKNKREEGLQKRRNLAEVGDEAGSSAGGAGADGAVLTVGDLPALQARLSNPDVNVQIKSMVVSALLLAVASLHAVAPPG